MREEVEEDDDAVEAVDPFKTLVLDDVVTAGKTAAEGLKHADTPWVVKWFVTVLPKDDQNPLGFNGEAILAAQLL